MALKYQIALASVWWNDDYKDVRRFSSFEDQKEYFSLDERFEKAPVVNFEIKDLLRPRIVFKEPNIDVFDVLNANYLIVKDTHDTSVQKYFYYFIDTIKQDVGDQYIADCKLDVWQTFQFCANIGHGLVERAHLNRFKTGNSNIGFDFSENSPLLIEEKSPEDSNKLLTARYPLNLPFRTSAGKSIGAWCEEHLSGWKYVFIEGNSNTYKGLKFNSETIPEPENAPGSFVAGGTYSKGNGFPYSIIVVPIYKPGVAGKIIINDANDTHSIQLWSGYELFRYYNNGYSFIYAEKNLPVNPLYKFLVNKSDPLNFLASNARIDANGDLVIRLDNYAFNPNLGYAYDVSSDMAIIPTNTMLNGVFFGALFFGIPGGNTNIEYLQKQILAPTNAGNPFRSKPFQDTKQELKENFLAGLLTREKTLNPKLYGASYKQIRLNIANQGAASFSYAQLATDDTSTSAIKRNLFIARAAIVPEIETLGLSPYLTMLYVWDDYKAVFGTVLTTDFSIAFKNNVYESYLANNKNFWLQNKLKWNEEAFNLTAGAANQAFNKSQINPISLVSGFVGIGLDYFNTKYQINNMQNAPGLYSAGSGSTSYVLASDIDFSYYADLYVAPEYILERDDDFMYLYGYKYGKMALFENVVNIRACFNYVKGEFESISGPLSDTVRRELFNSLASGVRFWNVDRPEFNFNTENLENFILED